MSGSYHCPLAFPASGSCAGGYGGDLLYTAGTESLAPLWEDIQDMPGEMQNRLVSSATNGIQ